MAKKEKVNRYIKSKFKALEGSDYSLEYLFNVCHDQDDRFFCEYLDRFQVKEVSYSQFKQYVYKMATYLSNSLNLKEHEYVGLLMENSLNWVALFWAILMIGCKPVLLNKRLPISLLKEISETLSLKTIIADFEDKSLKTHYFNNENKIIPEIDALKPFIPSNWENEIALTTTATTLNYKICFFSGSDLTNQVKNAKGILKLNKQVKQSYKGRHKLLAFLPFYHIFGLIATYLWFSLFGRTFIFLKDYSNESILGSIRRHKITHVFAVPLLWNSIAKEIKKKIDTLPEKKRRLAYKGINLSYHLQNCFPNYGKRKASKLLKEIQEQVFGDSVTFCITGGGPIPEETLYLINSIGYRLFNGYGSTEIGITSVELGSKPKKRILGSIGKPFDSIQYNIQDDELLVRGSSICSRIIYRDGHEEVVDHDAWYHTNDIARLVRGRYYISGRQDDVCVRSNGEKINPDELEKEVLLTSVIRYCFTTINARLALVIQISEKNYELKSKTIIKEVDQCLTKLNKLGYQVDDVFYTFDELASPTAIKVSRTVLDYLIVNKKVKLSPYKELRNVISKDNKDLNNQITNRIKKAFAQALNIKVEEISNDSHFFYDLKGSSLEYMTLLMLLEKEFEVPMNFKDLGCVTVNDFYTYLIKEGLE